MKRKYSYKAGNRTVEREYDYIPFRYIIAIFLTALEVAAIIGIVILLCYYVPYFYAAALLTQVFCVIKIVSSDDNPDYKVPWLLFVMLLPVVGFMLYFIFYSRTLPKKYITRLDDLKKGGYEHDDTELFEQLKSESPAAYGQAKMLTEIADTHLFSNTKQTYFKLGEDMHASILEDLEQAKKFIYMEYFIIDEGKFWNSILEILKRKAQDGVNIKVVYDDIGCMMTLPGNYDKKLLEYGIQATPFSRLRGSADGEFNNRSHRKILVIDGKVGYTGGVNIADEYINEKSRFGHWKDTGIRLEGEAVAELTNLFLIDFGLNRKRIPYLMPEHYPAHKSCTDGYVIPFGDGPYPLYERNVGKSVIQNMLACATEYVYMTTPYLILDNDLCTDIENAAMRGVDIRIIVPHIPDKKLVFEITRSFYTRLMKAGVRMYEYEPGFIHAKSYIADGKYAMIGTINLDYRSLVHHFENGVWLYGSEVIADMKRDIDETLEKCISVTPEMLNVGLFRRLIRSVARIFAPML